MEKTTFQSNAFLSIALNKCKKYCCIQTPTKDLQTAPWLGSHFPRIKFFRFRIYQFFLTDNSTRDSEVNMIWYLHPGFSLSLPSPGSINTVQVFKLPSQFTSYTIKTIAKHHKSNHEGLEQASFHWIRWTRSAYSLRWVGSLAKAMQRYFVERYGKYSQWGHQHWGSPYNILIVWSERESG